MCALLALANGSTFFHIYKRPLDSRAITTTSTRFSLKVFSHIFSNNRINTVVLGEGG